MIAIIPHGMMTAYFKAGETQTEVRILELSVIGFTFRLPADEIPRCDTIRIAVYMFSTGTNETVELTEFDITEESAQRFWIEYRMETSDIRYTEFVRRFMDGYARYIQLKNEEDHKGIAEMLSGSLTCEEDYCADISEQRDHWKSQLCLPENIGEFDEIAVALSDPRLIAQYLEFPLADFLNRYYSSHGLSDHPVSRRHVSCIYIGNQYCDLLRPDPEILCRVILKAREESLRTVVCLAPVPEWRIEDAKRALEYLESHIAPDEIVVNDWGMLSLLRDVPIGKTLGILLCKRRKDPRTGRLNYGSENAAETSIDVPEYRAYLAEHFSVRRFSYECTECVIRDRNSAVLHWPMIQLNTSGTCALRAACLYGDRAAQCTDDDCAMHCLDHHFFYPKDMNMIGEYNTLFAFAQGKSKLQAGRLVIDLP